VVIYSCVKPLLSHYLISHLPQRTFLRILIKLLFVPSVITHLALPEREGTIFLLFNSPDALACCYFHSINSTIQQEKWLSLLLMV